MPSTRPRKMMSLALGAALGVALLAGCGGDDDDADAEETTTTEATTTTEEESTTTEEGGTTTEADDGDGEVEADEEATEVDWQTNASEHRDRLGRRVAFDCPPDGEPATIWGTGTYTDDSSVCTAAVHAGLITLADGGRVVIEVTAGQESYEASEANGIESLEYPDWPGSFTFAATDEGDDGIGGDTGAEDDGPVGEGTDDGSGIGDSLEDDDEG